MVEKEPPTVSSVHNPKPKRRRRSESGPEAAASSSASWLPALSDEEEEWLRMTSAQRFEESGKLWALYLALGGSLDPEPDLQSPFYFPNP